MAASYMEFMLMFGLAFIGVGVYTLAFYKVREIRSGQTVRAGEFISRWNSPDFMRISSMLFDLEQIDRIRHAEGLDELSREEFNSTIVLLNFFEEMGLAIESRIVAESLLERYFAQTATELFKVLYPLIETIRKERRNSSIFVNYEKLVGRWSFSDPRAY